MALVVDVYDEDWRRLEYALVRGTAQIVTRTDEFERALVLSRARYPQCEAMRLEAGRNEVVRITATGVHYWKASAGSERTTPSR